MRQLAGAVIGRLFRREDLFGGHGQSPRFASTKRTWLGSPARLCPRTGGEVCRVKPGERSNVVAQAL